MISDENNVMDSISQDHNKYFMELPHFYKQEELYKRRIEELCAKLLLAFE